MELVLKTHWLYVMDNVLTDEECDELIEQSEKSIAVENAWEELKSWKRQLIENVKKEMLIVINKELSTLEKGLNFLASVGSTAPFIGLFGTVWGIMNSFTAIGISQNTSLAVVAPGIAEALFATALGLVAAIPSVLFFNKFNNMLENISNKLEVFSEEIILIISKEIFR